MLFCLLISLSYNTIKNHQQQCIFNLKVLVVIFSNGMHQGGVNNGHTHVCDHFYLNLIYIMMLYYFTAVAIKIMTLEINIFLFSLI